MGLPLPQGLSSAISSSRHQCAWDFTVFRIAQYFYRPATFPGSQLGPATLEPNTWIRSAFIEETATMPLKDTKDDWYVLVLSRTYWVRMETADHRLVWWPLVQISWLPLLMLGKPEKETSVCHLLCVFLIPKWNRLDKYIGKYLLHTTFWHEEINLKVAFYLPDLSTL